MAGRVEVSRIGLLGLRRFSSIGLLGLSKDRAVRVEVSRIGLSKNRVVRVEKGPNDRAVRVEKGYDCAGIGLFGLSRDRVKKGLWDRAVEKGLKSRYYRRVLIKKLPQITFSTLLLGKI